MQKPRLVRINGRVQLCMITYNTGEMTDLNGPVQCISEPGMEGMVFVNKLVELLGEAVHTSKVLELTDLPEKMQTEIQDAINAAQATEDTKKEVDQWLSNKFNSENASSSSSSSDSE